MLLIQQSTLNNQCPGGVQIFFNEEYDENTHQKIPKRRFLKWISFPKISKLPKLTKSCKKCYVETNVE